MIDKKEFLTLCNLTEEALNNSNIQWEDLEKIAAEYEKLETAMHDISKDFIDEYLYDIDKAGIHSYRYRVKDTGHLLEKVIRKKRENPAKFDDLDHTNFYKFVTDLIGIRVFFLYREDFAKFAASLNEAIGYVVAEQGEYIPRVQESEEQPGDCSTSIDIEF